MRIGIEVTTACLREPTGVAHYARFLSEALAATFPDDHLELLVRLSRWRRRAWLPNPAQLPVRSYHGPWLRSPWPYLATLAAIAGCWNLLLYNLMLNPGEALRQADWYDYAYRPKASLGEYLAAGVRAVVLVNPEKTTVTIYRPDDERPATMLRGEETFSLPEVLPGWELPVSRFFK